VLSVFNVNFSAFQSVYIVCISWNIKEINISSLCFCDCIYIMSRNLCYNIYPVFFFLLFFNTVRYGVKSRTFVCSTCEGELLRVLL